MDTTATTKALRAAGLGIAVMGMTAGCYLPHDSSRVQTVVSGASTMVVSTSGDAISAVGVHVNNVSIFSSTTGWMPLATDPQAIELLSLAGATTRLLGEAELEQATYTQIRLTVERTGWVTIGDRDYPMSLRPSADPVIVIAGTMRVTGGRAYRLLLDFDALRSVGHDPNDPNGYILDPQITIASFDDEGTRY
jgi:hypothetical protein